MTEDALYRAVRDAWAATLPEDDPDADPSWGETGADSLATLHLILRLERRLGRRIAFDLVTPDVTAAGLAARLAPRDGATADVRDDAIFLVPGVFGDEPILAAFRASFGAALRFETLALPDLADPAATLADLPATGRFLADEIGRRRPRGAIRIAGYSFGASAAYEAAVALAAAGRTVAFVGLLDPWHPAERPAGATSGIAAQAGRRATHLRSLFRRGDESLAASLHWSLFALLVHGGAPDAARRFLRALGGITDARTMLRARRYLLHRLRREALRQWRPRPLQAPVLLALSQFSVERGAGESWAALCTALETVRLPGGHRDLFAPAAAARLTPAFAEAAGRARAVIA